MRGRYLLEMKKHPPTLTQTGRVQATRSRILETARRHILAHGYEGASLEAILKEAGLSKGALYHHFTSKEEILAALFESAVADLVALAQKAARPASPPLENMTAASLAWLAAVAKPAYAKLVLEEGPQWLGWARARAIEERYAMRPMVQAFEQAQAKGATLSASPALSARILNAALTELALTQRQRKKSAPLAEVEALLRALVRGLARPGAAR